MPTRGYSATVDGSGSATVAIRPPSTRMWVVRQVSVELTGDVPSTATCVVRLNGRLVTPLVATGDAGGGDPPVELQPTDEMTVEFGSATAGNVAGVLIIYDQE